jgi:general L-amino acid transport system substrate-binding protein
MSRNKSGMSRRRFLGAAGAGAAGVAGAAMAGSGVASAAKPAAAPERSRTLLQKVLKNNKIRVVTAPETFHGLIDWPLLPNDDPDVSQISGFEPDLARALAAAIFNISDPKKIEKHIEWVVPSGWDERFTEVREGRADVGFGLATNTTTRDTIKVVDYAPTYYYDAQQVWTEEDDLEDITKLGYLVETTGEAVAKKLYGDGRVGAITSFEESYNEEGTGMVNAYKDGISLPGGIDAMITDASGNIANSIKYDLDGQHLNEKHSKEALTPFTAEHEPELMDVLREVMHSLFEAERRGYTKSTVPKDFGAGLGPKLGLSKTWAYAAVKLNGNYKEIWEKNLVEDAWYPGGFPERGLNDIWTNGGLHYQGAYR